MWAGLIVGLTAAAVLLGWRFERSSRRHVAGAQDPLPASR